MSDTPQARQNDHSGPQTITIRWASTAMEQAIERLRAIVESQASGPDVTHVVADKTITWTDLACLLDITAAKTLQTEVEQLRADVDRWQQTALAATEDREEASENAATHAKKASELASENDRLRRALATHLFDREALSILQATPVELIEQQHAELTRLRKQLSAGETTSSNEYEVRYPPGIALEPEQFNDIRDASSWQQLYPGSQLFQRTVTTTAVKGEWEEVQ